MRARGAEGSQALSFISGQCKQIALKYALERNQQRRVRERSHASLGNRGPPFGMFRKNLPFSR